MGRLHPGTVKALQDPRRKASASTGHKLEAVLAAVERIGKTLDQTEPTHSNEAPTAGRGPKVLLFRNLHFADRDAILQVVRSLLALRVDKSNVLMFPDYTIAVQKKSSSFLSVKRNLQALGLVYSLFFSAKLRIIV
ncbi:hypothetical protein NDU88_009469 [Pleurodeles waltl]|uniref:Uncharacterized protein n=1 Tax=Pleurodeles waltl TaxID=8319 RepID=A0AAV7PUS1_PLEWA|nr:hypothetical protein NDU88_009469 [Pleurodeles waltl]